MQSIKITLGHHLYLMIHHFNGYFKYHGMSMIHWKPPYKNTHFSMWKNTIYVDDPTLLSLIHVGYGCSTNA